MTDQEIVAHVELFAFSNGHVQFKIEPADNPALVVDLLLDTIRQITRTALAKQKLPQGPRILLADGQLPPNDLN